MEIGQVTNRFSIPDESVSVNNQLGLVTFNVKREAGDGDIAELNVILKDKDGTSKNFPQDFRTTGFNTHESKRVEITYLGSGISQLASISLSATIKNQDGKELKGAPVSAYSVKGNEKLAGVVLWLDFENGIIDKSGNGNTGELGGTVNIGADDTASPNKKSGKVATFSGAGSIDIGDKDSLDFGTGDFSFAFWAKPSTTNGQVLEKLGNTNPVRGYNAVFFYSNNFYLIPSIITESSNSPQYPASSNVWKFYIVVFNRTSKEISVYTGDPRGSSLIKLSNPLGYNNLGTASIDNAASFVIGKKSSGINPYTGKLDDIEVFNRALSLAEANKIYAENKASFT